ncbi:MAG: 2-polyprenyl-3-methyl-5-hydroxy-6-metoxy-1,4-benzoquinol methylase [Phenylobacterium sp.]|jgi:2-polyprenyl-3-methyl-5-hydroxy-6-metoxy-1,4-benzoquinol methylase
MRTMNHPATATPTLDITSYNKHNKPIYYHQATLMPLTDKQIIDSWKTNVKPWINAITSGEITSRVNVTNQAIIDAVLAKSPKKVLDAGCGEGWLSAALAQTGIDVMGTDVVPALVAHAQQTVTNARFKTIAFEDLSIEVMAEKFDLIVANFSLLGKESVESFCHNAAGLLKPNGWLIVQTIHPLSGCGEAEYKDGWRTGSWAGFSDEFSNPAPWYFRTLPSWIALFTGHGFNVVEQLEPVNPQTQQPASVIFLSQAKPNQA